MSATTHIAKHLDARFAVKEVSDAGEFEGYASTYALDQDDEKIAPGAFKRTLDHSGGKVPILFGHSTMEPCGWNITAEEQEGKGLFVRGKLSIETETGKKAYYHLKGAADVGSRAGLSIGFRGIKSHYEDNPQDTKKQIRIWDEVQLLEYSVVVFPCNLEALVTSVKSNFDAAHQQQVDNQSPNGENQQQTETEEQAMDFTEVIKDDLYLANVVRAKAKGQTKRVDGVDLAASCFAYVGDPDKTDTWKLPIRFPGDDEKTKTHIRNALARFNQTEGIPAGEKPKVLARIRAAAREHGIDAGDDGKSMTPYNHSAGAANYDFDNVLGEHRRARENETNRRDIDNALVDTLSRIHGSDAHPDEKKAAIRKAYHKHAEHMADCHIKEMFPDESYGGGPATGEGKSLAIIGDVKASLGALSNLLAKAGRRVSAANAAALIDTAHMHHKALKHHVDVLKDVVGDTTRLPEIPNDGDESYGGGPATGESKSGRRMSQATKAALKDAYHEHRKALHNHHRVLKSMFEDNTPLDDGALDDPDLGNDEMGAMSSRQQVTGKSADDLLKDVNGRLAALTAK